MNAGQVIGMLCNACKTIIKINDKNHVCSIGNVRPQTFQQINPRNPVCDAVECLEPEPEPEPLDGDGDSETMSKLIDLIRERHPLWDHRLPLSARFESIKKLLWNEIYVELNGVHSIDILKKKWRYLREKYSRENKKPKSGSGGEKRRSWMHMQCLQFLDDLTTKNKKTTSNFSLSQDTLDIPDSEGTSSKRKKDELSFQEAILQEMQASRPIPPQAYEQPREDEDPQDTNFAKYVVTLMKQIPKKRKVTLQSEFISKLVQYIDD